MSLAWRALSHCLRNELCAIPHWQDCLGDRSHCLMTFCRAERDSLENSLFETQQLSRQLQAQREQLEGEAQSMRLAQQALQGAPREGSL